MTHKQVKVGKPYPDVHFRNATVGIRFCNFDGTKNRQNLILTLIFCYILISIKSVINYVLHHV